MQLFTRVSPNPDSLSYPLSFFSLQPPCRALYCTTLFPRRTSRRARTAAGSNGPRPCSGCTGDQNGSQLSPDGVLGANGFSTLPGGSLDGRNRERRAFGCLFASGWPRTGRRWRRTWQRRRRRLSAVDSWTGSDRPMTLGGLGPPRVTCSGRRALRFGTKRGKRSHRRRG